MSSTRLPGKSLKPIQGRPMLQLMMERLHSGDDDVLHVVATSTDPSDDPVAHLCARMEIPCVRGSLEDVLGRFIRVLDRFEPDVVVRLTGDNPLDDARAVLAGLEAFFGRVQAGEATVGVSNHLQDRTDPYGYCVEVVRAEALRILDESDVTREEREHVTLGFRQREGFSYDGYSILSGDHSNLRWTVDTEQDFRYVERLFKELGPDCPAEEAVQWSRANPHPSADPEAG